MCLDAGEIMKHWNLRELDATLTVTLHNCRLQRLSVHFYYQLVEPYGLATSRRSCHVLCLCWTQCHCCLLLDEQEYHTWPQAETKPWSAFPSTDIICLVRIHKTMQHQISISNILQTIVNCALQVSENVLRSCPMNLPQLNHQLAQCVHCNANIGTSIHQIHKGPNQLPIHRRIHQIWIWQLHIWNHGSCQGLAIQHLKPFQNLHCVLPLPKEDFSCTMLHLWTLKIVHKAYVLHFKFGGQLLLAPCYELLAATCKD